MKKIMYGAIALTLLVACSKESESIKPVIDLAAGEAIAAADCSGCHGMDGRGETADIPNLAAQPINYLVDAMHAYRDGGRQHAALQDMTAGMSEADITNIAGYYANLPALAHLEQTEAQATDSVAYSEGAEVAAICEECHGERGISTEAGLAFSVWGRNVTDHESVTTAFPTVANTGGYFGYRNQPRTYGVTVSYDIMN